ncbi:MAG TPA: EAL domain-containing protein [Kineosporiaceae bacterium]|nr:EAL domain-containing protein [Kineosporiaceae bacterium]
MSAVGDRSAVRAAGVPAARVGQGDEQVLGWSERTRVVRIRLPGGEGPGETIIRKELLGPDGPARALREAGILGQLAGIGGVPTLLGPPTGSALLIKDEHGTPLSALISEAATGMELLPALDLMIALSEILAQVHQRGVVHKDINPMNILLPESAGPPVLIDFGLAATVVDDWSAASTAGLIVGTLAYLAPEQTGRTGRGVDQRSDLYALGATCYELCTGRPPFGRGETDALALIHDHLARVPIPARDVVQTLPEGLSDIIARLLEKEPDRRYQSATGLAADLRRLREQPTETFPLGERDFPTRLSAPVRLVAREAEIDILGSSFADALAGHGRGLLITGEPGVGKTVLVDELRPIVAAAGGWVVGGAFGQNSQSRGSDAVGQALRGLGRLLLTEPEEALALHRAHLMALLGNRAPIFAALIPGLLPGVEPNLPTGDPDQVQSQIHQIGLEILRLISASRPVVMMLDDLQWAGSFPLGMIDAMLTATDLPGLLLVGAYRDGELSPDRPFAEMLARWIRLGVAPPRLRLKNLSPPDVGVMLREMLRISPEEAGRLAEAVGPRTDGNPYDTVELLNALRAEGALVAGPTGWTWDAMAIRRHVGLGDVIDLLAARVGRLPAPASAVLAVLAALGGRAEQGLLATATGLSATRLQEDLTPALDDGLVVLESGADLDDDVTLRFRHDRVRQAAGEQREPAAGLVLHLRIARRLAQDPAAAGVAAEQYLQAVTVVTDEAERRVAAGLFRRIATAQRITDREASERYLAAAIVLLASSPDEDEAELAALEVEHHAVLCSLGRFDESDRLYRSIEHRRPEALDLVGAACAQIAALTNRVRARDALALGLDLLARLGLAVPSRNRVDADIERGEQALSAWVEADTQAEDLLRPEVRDPRVNAAAELINRLMPAAYFADHQVLAWLMLQSCRLWTDHGPCRALIGPLGHAGVVMIERHEDYRTGYRVTRRVLDVGIRRGYEPETPWARFLFSAMAGHWFEPVEVSLGQASQAREGLLTSGDLQRVVFTYHTTTPALVDVAPTLEVYSTTVEAGLALATRTGNDQSVVAALPYRQLVRALRAETDEPGGFADSSFDEAEYLPRLDGNPMAAANFHITRAFAAAVFGDRAALTRHAALAMPLLPFLVGAYASARAYLLRSLALAGQLQAGEDEPGLLGELDTCRDWLARRATDAPMNFAHLVDLVDAERAWAVGDHEEAMTSFDAALTKVRDLPRPWHQALISERAARFFLVRGHSYLARKLLIAARQAYAEWGASSKVEQLDLEYPFLRTHRVSGGWTGRADPVMSVPGVSTDSIDLLAVLETSQALSSETDLDRLRSRVVDVLTAMTGATTVTVLLWNEGSAGWVLPATAADGQDRPACSMSVAEAGAAGLIPLSAFWYAERTRQPLLVPDATVDDRFAADPYVSGARCCSLLVVPILSRGTPAVMLVLENRLHRHAFSTDRLDGVLLIAGQLAVSFENAQARRATEQEADRRLRLLETLRQRERLLETLLAIQRDIAHRAPLQQVLDAVTVGASAMLDGDFVALVLVDPMTSDPPRIPSISGRGTGLERDALVLSVATEAIARDQVVARDSAGLIAAPVHATGKIIGSLVAGVGADPEHRAERQDLLSAFAEQVSLALNDASTLRMMREAAYDSLTGLASRPLFLDRLREALNAGAHGGQEVSVLFIDLDRFKAVNDTLGHKAGDDLLAGVADRLRGCIRGTDIAARLGGDEFAVLLEDTEGERSGLRVAEKVLAALQHPFRISGKDIFAGASIGISHGRASDCVAAELLVQADVAMYRAKQEGSRRAVVFEQQMQVEIAERLELQGDLRSALGTEALWMQYQPLMSFRTGHPVGVEALVRWSHPQRGLISPATFIPIAEETGTIVELGRWVLRESCRQAALWRASTDPQLGLSVNVSGRQLTDGRFADDVAAVLAETGLPAQALTLELTETVLMDDPADSHQRLSELKRLGVRLAIDDFGTGYSSLAYLRQFPVDELKIDKSFIDTIGAAEEDLAIVRTVIELARILGLRTTAEGIETRLQADLLRRLDCTSGQGYYFARPLDVATVADFLAKHRP